MLSLLQMIMVTLASPTVNAVCDGSRATIAGGQSCSLDDTDTAFGYQLLAGLGYEITENIKWDTQYRYLDAHGMDFNGIRVANTNNTVNSLAVEASNVGAHSVMTGFRYLFGHKHEPEAPPHHHRLQCLTISVGMDQ